MADSARIGQPPLNDNDKTIILGLFGNKTPTAPPIPKGSPDSQAMGMVIGLGFAIALVTIITGARLLVRMFRKGQKFGLDDWVIIPGVLLALAFYANILVRVHTSCAGKRQALCTYKEFGSFISLGGINQIFFFASVTLIKISMCLFNRRLTGISSRPWQIVNNTFLGVLIIWFFLTLFINIFQCTPVTGAFNFAIRVKTSSYSCLDSGMINNSFNIINCITDFMLLSVPIYTILRVQMPLGRKVRLVFIFLLGLACCTCSAYRSSFGYKQSKDVSWVFVRLVSWTIADIFFSAVVASLPALNALAEIVWAKAASSFGSSNFGTASSSAVKSAAAWLPMSDGENDPSRLNLRPGMERDESGFGGALGRNDSMAKMSHETEDVELGRVSTKDGY